jgi:uncharacterized coiled-coil DUF342 family protein
MTQEEAAIEIYKSTIALQAKSITELKKYADDKFNEVSKLEQELTHAYEGLRLCNDEILARQQEIDSLKAELDKLKGDYGHFSCDVCGCYPTLIIATEKGRFCEQHAQY